MEIVKNFPFSLVVYLVILVSSATASDLEQESCGTLEMVGIVKSISKDHLEIISSPKTFSEITVIGEGSNKVDKYHAGSLLRFTLEIQKRQKYRYKITGKLSILQELTLLEFAQITSKHGNSIITLNPRSCELSKI